jgi:Flp pilus assembly protein TadD
MASSTNRTILMLATALTAVACQSGAVTKAMNPAAGRGVAMLRAQSEGAGQEQVRDSGLSIAEQRVSLAPDDLEARRALAQIYFTSGRFRSAAQACDDALAIAPADEALRLKKALALLAQGNSVAAVGELDRIGNLPDAGLAYALAGQTRRGVDILAQAARHSDATPRTRQNLALALALDGQWARARVVAAQDLDAATLEARVRQWAVLVATADPAAQTAGLLEITPAADDGRPMELAYIPPEARVRQVAAAPAVVETSPLPNPVEVAAAAPIVVTPVAAAAPAGGAVKASASSPAPRLAARKIGAAVSTAPANRWVVQIAAYDRAELLEANWQRLRRNNAELLGDYEAVRSEVTIGNRRYYRLALAGFDGRVEAVDLCEALQAKGRACFVRSSAPPAQRTLLATRG